MGNRNFFVEPKDVETMTFDWGSFKVTCSPEVNGASGFSAGIVEMLPGGGHDRHNHPGAEEIIYVLAGEGEQMVEDEDGNPIVSTVTAGCTIYVPESRYHYTVNTGKDPMRVFVVYSPAGSERELRKLPDCRIVPAEQSPAR
ncbi:cupin domain-containing protein [uncultured Paenibacillus sp.]|uniref:cupin domain-containing protein n=1 Tax=uncultured Paenibacillus sp. TaxID=227322 RepID=UPI0028D495DB|nr:cupin domain-containing protein [uncultured Paenibacillus sp.]